MVPSHIRNPVFLAAPDTLRYTVSKNLGLAGEALQSQEKLIGGCSLGLAADHLSFGSTTVLLGSAIHLIQFLLIRMKNHYV